MFRLLKEMKYYKVQCILAPLFKMLEALFELFVPLVVSDIIDYGIRTGDKFYIYSRAGIMLLLGIVGLCFSITAQYFSARAAVGFSTRIRYKLFSKLQRISYTETDTVGTSTMVTRLTGDINQVQSGINLTLRLLLRSPFVVFGAMIMAFTIDKTAGLIFLAMIALLSVIVFGIMLSGIPMYKRVREKLDRVLGVTRENLTGVRVIRAFGLEENEKASFGKVNREQTQLQRFVGKISSLMNPLTFAVVNLAIIWLLYVGSFKVDSGALSQGQIVALYNYMTQILIELVKMANVIINIAKAVASGNRVQAALELPEEASPDTKLGTFSSVPGAPAVSFSDVSLRYRGAAEPSLSNISFSVDPGETFGVIGGTGSGKSSLVHLIPRFYDAETGEIKIGGHDIRSIPLPILRSKIGIVPQKAVLFRGTVRSNLLFSNPSATDADMIEALTAAQAADFVLKHEKGLDAPVEQGGKNFSGGQRQRLTVARALVRKPEILILDDASSALDYATDANLRAAISELPYHPTVFFVSQRTASLRSADRILVLDDGEPVGIGTHEELLTASEVYREIHRSQFAESEESAV